MKVIYKPTVFEQILEAKKEADHSCKEIAYIALTDKEVDTLWREEHCRLYQVTRCACLNEFRHLMMTGKCVILGVRLDFSS